jgi:hypothetical protein
MKKVAENELMAAECRRMAAQVKNPQQKRKLDDMAEIWERLARERRRGIVEKNPDDTK